LPLILTGAVGVVWPPAGINPTKKPKIMANSILFSMEVALRVVV